MEKIILKILAAGYKLTTPRLAVIKKMSQEHRPLSARDLSKKIKMIDQVSVYRTLSLLVELGVANAQIIDKEKIYCLSGQPHHHIVCKKCGYTEEVECHHHFNKFKNFINVHHQLILTGLCHKCSK